MEEKDHRGEQEQEYQSLEKELGDLQSRIDKLQAVGVTTDLKPQMQALKTYNQVKDLTQLVLEHLANAENAPLKALYKKYELPTSD